jgi:hypothetical protein
MPRKVFVAGEILTAADVNTNLMDQAVMVFDDSAARGSAIPTPSEGMVTYLKDDNRLTVFDGAAYAPVGTILQVVSTTKTDTFSTSSSSFADVTGLSATITPSSSSSKILILASLNEHSTTHYFVRLARGATGIALGDTAGSRVSAYTIRQNSLDTNNTNAPTNMTFLDSPASTSALTYVVQLANPQSQTTFVNRGTTDTDNNGFARGVSTITLMEVAG